MCCVARRAHPQFCGLTLCSLPAQIETSFRQVLQQLQTCQCLQSLKLHISRLWLSGSGGGDPEAGSNDGETPACVAVTQLVWRWTWLQGLEAELDGRDEDAVACLQQCKALISRYVAVRGRRCGSSLSRDVHQSRSIGAWRCHTPPSLLHLRDFGPHGRANGAGEG